MFKVAARIKEIFINNAYKTYNYIYKLQNVHYAVNIALKCKKKNCSLYSCMT